MIKRIFLSLILFISLSSAYSGDRWTHKANRDITLENGSIIHNGTAGSISLKDQNETTLMHLSGGGTASLTYGVSCSSIVASRTIAISTTPSDGWGVNLGTAVKLCNGAEVYEDLRVPLTTTRVSPTSDKPDFDEDNVGFLFPDADVTEILYGAVQLPHSYKEGENLHAHVHWLQTSASTCSFKMDYMWTNQEASTTSFTTLQVGNTPQFTYGSGGMHQVSEFPEISGTGKTISSMFVFRLYRAVDDSITGDVLTWEIDFHYKRDSLGSRTEWTK